MARKRQRSSSDIADARKKQLTELPVDVLVDILLRLPAKSVGCIKCVSKTLLNMVNNISFSTLHTRSHTMDQVPRLICCSRHHPLLTLQSLKYKDNSVTNGRHAITISSSTYSFLRFVFCNLFCLGSKNGDSMLINPLGERGLLRLPETSFAGLENDSLFGMGFDDKTNTYKIVCVSCHDRGKSKTAHVLVLGTNRWRQISSLPPCELSRISDEPPVCANGAVHWLIMGQVRGDRRIVSFDFRREEFCWTPIPPTLQSSNKHHGHYVEWNICLFSLRGCLAIAVTKFPWSIMEVWVLKDSNENQWVRYYYSNELPAGFPFKLLGFPGEWEHGIFLTDYNLMETSFFFIDLRSGSISTVKYKCSTRSFLLSMHSYSETLISLKDYGDLEEAHEVIT
ncbi:hypothetical protein ACLB2K_046436 [Fragaria x ananassa]